MFAGMRSTPSIPVGISTSVIAVDDGDSIRL